MENYSYSTYPDSGHSSPRSRDIDSVDNASWDESQPPSSNYKVKFMCSYGGKIHPRPHDNQLTYLGGDTKIFAVDRNTRFSTFISKLSSLCDSEVCFKYQLPGEDLDALISVTNDEDLDHMMLEYDRLFRASPKPARLRLFLFPLNATASFGTTETKSERQWFVDALNSVQIQNIEDSSSPPASVSSAATPDFLFGLEKNQDVSVKNHDEATKEISVNLPADMQRLQISNNEQAVMYQRKSDEANARALYGDFYSQKIPENFQSPLPVNIPSPYWPERQMNTVTEQQVYLIPTSAGVYPSPTVMRPVTGQVGQGYYGMQRVVPEGYREQPVYSGVPPQQTRIGGYNDASGMVRPEHYAQVSYDGAGRQVYYTAPGRVVPQYQPVAAQGGGSLNQEGKVVADVSHNSPL